MSIEQNQDNKSFSYILIDCQRELQEIWQQYHKDDHKEDNNNKEDVKVKVYLTKVNNNDIKSKLCDCPNSEPGNINLDPSVHEANCWVRKRLQTTGYTIDTSVALENFKDGYSLGLHYPIDCSYWQ